MKLFPSAVKVLVARHRYARERRRADAQLTAARQLVHGGRFADAIEHFIRYSVSEPDGPRAVSAQFNPFWKSIESKALRDMHTIAEDMKAMILSDREEISEPIEEESALIVASFKKVVRAQRIVRSALESDSNVTLATLMRIKFALE